MESKTKSKRMKHPEAFKLEAVRLLEGRGERTVADVAESLGVAENMLYAWKKEVRQRRRASAQRARWRDTDAPHERERESAAPQMAPSEASLLRETISRQYSESKSTDELVIKTRPAARKLRSP